MAIGSLAQQFGISADLLHIFVSTIVKEWKFSGRKWEDDPKFIQGVEQGFEQSRAVCKQRSSCFEQFYESLESFVLTKSRLGDPVVADKSDTKSHPESTGAASNAQNPLRQEQTLKQPAAQQSLFCASEAVYGQGDCKRHDRKPLQPSQLGKWKEVQGFGSWTIRVYDSIPKIEDAL